ncbi:hypothetical protein [Methanosarcina sp. DH2]|nr:hypothetical protein [Methanosarcina sp. DH2]
MFGRESEKVRTSAGINLPYMMMFLLSLVNSIWRFIPVESQNLEDF